MVSLYQDLGGAQAVATLVDALYARVLADAELAPLFAGRDLARLKEHQRAFVAASLGGPRAYTGRDLRAAHAGAGIGQREWRRYLTHLREALDELELEPALVDQVVVALSRLEAKVLMAGVIRRA